MAYNSQNSGFSLLEILLAIAILSSILVAVFVFGLDIADWANFFGQSLTGQEELQQTLKVMKTELRSLGPSSIGGYPIESASSTALVFFSDLDGDSLFERVRYFLDGNILKKGIIKPTGNPLTYSPVGEQIKEKVHFVTNDGQPIFNFFAVSSSKDSLPLAEPVTISQIRMIKTEVTVDENPRQLPGPSRLEIWVTPRNLRFQ